jgi:hypothetical protein
MPDEDISKFETAEHDQHDDLKGLEGGGGSDAGEQAKGAFATTDAVTGATVTGPAGISVADGAIGSKASSADGPPETGDAGVPVHEPQPPHTGSGPFPDPP